MKRFILISILFTSCSVFKHNTGNSSSQKDLTVHAVQRWDSLGVGVQARRIRFVDNDELGLTEIIPEGKFVYQPDSGFRGAAKSVRVYRHTKQRSLEKDSAYLGLVAGSNRVGVDSILHQQAHWQLEETRESKPVPVWWMYLLAALVLLFAIRYVWGRG